jgi:threonine dehydrogenase-like Zn-dependent dehydrogenase
MKALLLDGEWNPRSGYVPSERERAEHRAANASQVYRGPTCRVGDIPVPEPGPSEVLVKVKACGVCGSDLHMLQTDADGYMLSADPAKLPVVLGHEFSGVVEALGPGAQGLRPGEPVCVESGQWCGHCVPCRAGIFGQCSNLNEHGFSLDGGFTEYVLTKPQYCWSIGSLIVAAKDADAGFEAGALVEPLSVVYNALFVRAGGFLPGSDVAIFGAGPIGLACIVMARFAGAGTIVALDTVAERRELAVQLGADSSLDPVAIARDGQDVADAIRDRTGGAGVAVSIEAAGAGRLTFPVLERAMALGGKIVQVGVGAGQTPVTMITMQTRNANIYGAMGSSGFGIFPAVIRLIATGRLPASALVTARYPLARVLEAFDRTAERRDGKVMVFA